MTWLGSSRRRSALISMALLVVMGIVLVSSSGIVGRYGQSLLTTLLLYVAAVSAWNLVAGIAGQFSLAHSVFIGTGGYVVLMLLRDSGLPLWVCIAASILGGAVLAWLMGVVLFRLKGVYFTVGSLGFAVAALAWMTTWDVTGGTQGVNAPLALIPDRGTTYLIAIVLAVVTIGISIAMRYSGFGLRLMSVRDDEEVADSLGVSPLRHKLVALTVSGALTAAVGTQFALQNARIEPFSGFGINWTVTIVIMGVIGGLGSVWGPVIGAVVVYYGLTVQLRELPTVSVLITGLALIVIVRFIPGGIWSAVVSVVQRLPARRSEGG